MHTAIFLDVAGESGSAGGLQLSLTLVRLGDLLLAPRLVATGAHLLDMLFLARAFGLGQVRQMVLVFRLADEGDNQGDEDRRAGGKKGGLRRPSPDPFEHALPQGRGAGQDRLAVEETAQ